MHKTRYRAGGGRVRSGEVSVDPPTSRPPADVTWDPRPVLSECPRSWLTDGWMRWYTPSAWANSESEMCCLLSGKSSDILVKLLGVGVPAMALSLAMLGVLTSACGLLRFRVRCSTLVCWKLAERASIKVCACFWEYVRLSICKRWSNWL